MQFANRVQIGHKIIIIAERVDALVERRHDCGRVLAQLHRLVQFARLQVLESIEQVEQVLVLLKQAARVSATLRVRVRVTMIDDDDDNEMWACSR